MAETTVIPAHLLEQIESGNPPAILDVRSRQEFVRGHVPGAINRPFWAVVLGLARVPFSVDEPVVVYCGHGPRARMAGQALDRRGFRHVQYLRGHMTEWRRKRLREER